VANFLPVRIRGSAFPADVLPFESHERLAALRAELRGTHVVSRDDDRIVCVPLASEAPDVGMREKFTVGDHHRLAMRLVREALINEVVGMRYKLRSFRRPAFVSRYRQQDLLGACAGEHRDLLGGLHVFPEYQLETRVCGPNSQPGVIVGLKTRYEIDLTVAELLDRGLAMDGRYVLAETGEVPHHPDLDEHAYRRLVGGRVGERPATTAARRPGGAGG
jgi:hypothetical protein